jgi:hypothetical protein
VSYGIHHCHGSWREFGLGYRIREHITRTVRRFI